MSRGLSVVVVVEGTPELTRLMRSLDQQSLPVVDFDVLVVDRGLTERSRTRLRDLAGRRPNLVLIDPSDGLTGRLGERAVLVTPGSRLFPDALEHLVDEAGATEADILVGRSVFPDLPLAAPFLHDVEVQDARQRERALRAPVMIVGRDWVDESTGRLVSEVSRASVRTLTRFPISEETGSGGAPVPGAPVVDDVETSWVDLVLEVRCSGTWTGVVPDEGDQLVAVLRRLGTSVSYIADSDAVVEPGSWNVLIRVDPAVAAGGDPLPGGIFEIDLVLVRQSGSTAPVSVPSGGRSGALSPEVCVLVATGAVSGRLQIDVGPAYFPLLHEVDPEDVRVVELVTGSVMTIALPYATGADATVPARLGLGSLRLPARVDCRNGEASFTAFVSGLCGDVEISSQFGHARFQPSGVSLLIDGVGAMSAVRTSSIDIVSPTRTQLTSSTGLPRPVAGPPQPVAAPPGAEPADDGITSAGEARSPDSRPSSAAGGRIVRLRQAVPARLEPLARAASRRPWARSIYRSLVRWTG